MLTFTSDHVTTRLKLDRGRLVRTHYTLRLLTLLSLGNLMERLNQSLPKDMNTRKNMLKIRWQTDTDTDITKSAKDFSFVLGYLNMVVSSG